MNPELPRAGRRALRQPAPIGVVIVGCAVMGAVTLLIPSSLAFDPLTWSTWAREIAHLRLDTRGGPAWKPLPVILDVVFWPFGPAQRWLWLAVARGGGLLAVAMSYRLARRLAGWWAGAVAGAGMLLSESLLEYLTPLGMSEPLMAALALLAIERHLDRRYGQVYGLVFACLLLRPETFPFFVAYSAFMWARFPRSRPWVIFLATLLPLAWLLPDYVGSGDWLRSSRRASNPTQGGPLLTSFPALAVLEGAFNAVALPIVVGAVIAMVSAACGYARRREERVTLLLSLLCVGWVVEEAIVTQLRLGSGDQRYLIVGYALGCTVAGVGWVRFVGAASSALAKLVGARTPALARAAVLAIVLVGSAPFVWQRLDDLSAAAGDIPYWVRKDRELSALITAAGGRERILACGPLTSDIYQMPALAWHLDIHQSQIIIGARPTGTVFRTQTTRRSPVLPQRLGSSEFRLVARTGQWQVLSTCAVPPR